jgi:hypothetical protein
MVQIISIVGSILILVAYTANQAGRLTAEQLSYSLLNVIGAGILATVAAIEEQWGFLLLEGVWTVVSIAALMRTSSGRPSASGRRHT